MTGSPSPSELLAIRTANAALLNSPDASVDMVATVVFALSAAGLLANCADCDGTGCDDCPACPACDLPDWQRCVACGSCQCDRHDNCTRPAVTVAQEDPHDSPLHHQYRVPRDLPIIPGQQVRL